MNLYGKQLALFLGSCPALLVKPYFGANATSEADFEKHVISLVQSKKNPETLQAINLSY